MSAIKLATPSSGSISLSPADTSSNLTITVPAVTGTMAIQGPAFSAYNSGYQTVSNATWTKMNCDTENFDTNSNFASSAFTPTVAGYYQFNLAVVVSSSATGFVACAVYKNGSRAFSGNIFPNASQAQTVCGSALLYANGTTDYFEAYFYQSSGSNMSAGFGDATSGFSGAMVRAA